MTTSWFCSDLHFGHKNIGKFRAPLIHTEEENRNRILKDWYTLVNKRDAVYILGDFCFDIELMDTLLSLPGQNKYLIRGNHDEFDLGVYQKYFTNVYGIKRYKEFWLAHAPIHPDELRGKINLHGHVHYATIKDKRYFNCCPENLWVNFNTSLVSVDTIRKYLLSLP